MSIQSEINRIAGEVDTQSTLIAQIAEALDGKATGSGGGSPEPQLTLFVTTARVNSNTQEISFNALPSQPKAFAIVPTGNITLSTSTRYVTSIMFDGETVHGTYCYSTGSSTNRTYTAAHSSSYFTPTYNNRTLTIRTSSATNGGYFAANVGYALVAIC